MRRDEQFKIGEDVADLFAIVERHPADEHVRQSDAPQFHFEWPWLLVRAEQDGEIARLNARLAEPALQVGDDLPGLVGLVLALHDPRFFTGWPRRAEHLLVALAVEGDQRVRHREDLGRRAVIVFKPDNLRFRPIVLEPQDVGHFRAAPAIDRLIVVSDNAQIAMLRGQRLHDPILVLIRVLIFIDEQMGKSRGLGFARGGKAGEHFLSEHQQVVEIDRAASLESLLIASIGRRREMLLVGLGQPACLLRSDGGGFPATDEIEQIARPQRFVGDADLAEHRAGDALLIVPVADRELRRIAQMLNLPPQHANAERMKCRDFRFLRLSFAEHFASPLLHLGGRLVGERDGQDSLRGSAMADQFGDAVRDNARLARARAGEDEKRAGERLHRFALRGIEMCHTFVKRRVWRIVRCAGWRLSVMFRC